MPYRIRLTDPNAFIQLDVYVYGGKQGTEQFGASYSYTQRQTWSGVTSATSNSPVNPLAIENMVMTSFRYYLP